MCGKITGLGKDSLKVRRWTVLPNLLFSCKHSSALKNVQVTQELGFRRHSGGYCNSCPRRNFTACELFPQGRTYWICQIFAKSTENQQVSCAQSLALHVLWKTLPSLSNLPGKTDKPAKI